EAVVNLLRAKQAGQVFAVPETPAPDNVVNIMDALKRSLEAEGGDAAVRRPRAPSKKPAAADEKPAAAETRPAVAETKPAAKPAAHPQPARRGVRQPRGRQGRARTAPEPDMSAVRSEAKDRERGPLARMGAKRRQS